MTYHGQYNHINAEQDLDAWLKRNAEIIKYLSGKYPDLLPEDPTHDNWEQFKRRNGPRAVIG